MRAVVVSTATGSITIQPMMVTITISMRSAIERVFFPKIDLNICVMALIIFWS